MQSDAAMNQAWTAVRDMQTRACALAMGNPSACLRIGGIKLLEQAVLAFTADTAPTALPGDHMKHLPQYLGSLAEQLAWNELMTIGQTVSCMMLE